MCNTGSYTELSTKTEMHLLCKTDWALVRGGEIINDKNQLFPCRWSIAIPNTQSLPEAEEEPSRGRER